MTARQTDSLDALLTLTDRMRGLLEDARSRYPEAVATLPPKKESLAVTDEAAPRAGADAWRPSNEVATPHFVDEEGDDNALPLEFATATMGHVLLGQGRRDEAREVFRAVLARTPDDVEALRGIEALGDDKVKGYGALVLRALPVGSSTITVFWEVPGAVGSAEALELLVVSLRPGLHGEVTRGERRVKGIPATGERFVHNLPSGAEHHVALRVVRDGKVTPVAHADVVRTPRGTASSRSATTRATVATGTTAPRGAGASSEVFDAAQRAWTEQGTASS